MDLYGRVGLLLKVGTEFHHELTGRTNNFKRAGLTQLPATRGRTLFVDNANVFSVDIRAGIRGPVARAFAGPAPAPRGES